MPDVREKLVELLGSDVCKHDICDDCECQGSTDICIATLKANMADHLIANGVTFAEDTNVPTNSVTRQRWIPVTERLPEDDIPSARYLCYANGYVRILKYWRMYKSFEYGGKPIKVTHWMPLPEPPKGQ